MRREALPPAERERCVHRCCCTAPARTTSTRPSKDHTHSTVGQRDFHLICHLPRSSPVESWESGLVLLRPRLARTATRRKKALDRWVSALCRYWVARVRALHSMDDAVTLTQQRKRRARAEQEQAWPQGRPTRWRVVSLLICAFPGSWATDNQARGKHPPSLPCRHCTAWSLVSLALLLLEPPRTPLAAGIKRS